MFLIRMFLQQVFRSTPGIAFGANEKHVISRCVVITASVELVQYRSSYVRNGSYIGISCSHAIFYLTIVSKS
jgi:hypothetical protein